MSNTFTYHFSPGLFVLLSGLLLSACELINPAEEIPAFLYIPAFQVETDRTQGSASAKITDVWVTVDDQFLGAYPLPAVIPILASGAAEIRLEAGIKDSGIAARPEIYPFYAPFTDQIDLNPRQIDTIRPLIRYRENIRFAFIEDFDKGTHLFQELLRGDDFNRISLSDESAFEGNFSGKLLLDRVHPLVELATSERFRDLSTRGFQVYLEINYRSEAPVVFGIIGRSVNTPGDDLVRYDPGFLPSENWNKIYLNLSLLVLDNPFDEYQISLQAFLPQENGNFTVDNATVWLDNIKLIHF